MKLTFEIIFKSDYHIGAGHGLPPEVDSALHRDSDGAPVIRGTVLAGLLRQGLYDLLQLPPLQHLRRCQASGKEDGPDYCGQWGEASDPCPICAILGTPAHPKPWQIASARPVDALKPLSPSERWTPGETAAQITTRARIHPRTRRAEHNKLFAREEGDGRLRFRFEASTPAAGAEALNQAAWLAAAARMVRRLGSGRRRGLGECEIQVQGDDPWTQDKLLDRFAMVVRKQIATEVEEGGPEPVSVTLPETPLASPYRVGVLVRLDEPLLAARRAEAGNRFESIAMLPGTLLRGALAWRIAQRFGSHLQGDMYEAFLDLFFREGVRFSFLYPVRPASANIPQGYLHLPGPRDLRTCELYPGYAGAGGHGVWSKLGDDYPEPETCPQCGASPGAHRPRLKPLNGFIELNSAKPVVNCSPTQSVEMHIRMEPRSGRVERGALFEYVALEPGQYFVGEIACADEQVWQALLAMADLTEKDGASLRLGKATRRGHGLVSLAWLPQKPPSWRGETPLTARVTGTEGVIMTFLSDAIITDAWGRHVRGFEADWIARELGLAPEQVTVVAGSAFSQVRPVASFSGHLGLPRWEDRALVAGSTVALNFHGIDVAALQQKLAAAENAGLGWRREEGFGLVAFNHPLHQAPEHWEFDRIDLNALKLAESRGSAKVLADFRAQWEAHLDAVLTSKPFAHESFGAVARIIHAAPGRRGPTLAQDLKGVGLQEQVIPTPLPGRDNVPLAEKDEGRVGMRTLFSLLEALKEQVEEGARQGGNRMQLWKEGLAMLAERIAAYASNAKKQKEAN